MRILYLLNTSLRLLPGLLFALLTLSNQQATGQKLAEWTFGNTTAPTTVTANVTASNALYVNSGATMSLTVVPNRYTCDNWTDNAINLAKYLEFSVTPNINYNLTVTQLVLNVQRTANSGPSNFDIRISTDGFVGTSASVGTGSVTNSPVNLTIPITTLVRNTNTLTVRAYFWGATSAARIISVGSATINGTVQRPTLTQSTTMLSPFVTTQGLPSATQSYVLSGSALVSDATLTAPAGFAISTSSGSGFVPTLTIAQTNGIIANTTIYVRLTGATTGPFTGNVTSAATSAPTLTVAVSGVVLASLPVDLISFGGKATGDQVQLSWVTAWERNADRYVVERSQNAGEFAAVGTRLALGTTDQRQAYSLTDDAPLEGVNYYRLKQLDRDQSVTYSKIVAVTVEAGRPFASLLQNPGSGQSVSLRLHRLLAPSLRLTSLSGQQLPGELTRQSDTEATYRPGRPLVPGLYVLTIQEGVFRQTLKVLVH